jgi:hypothetical protein
MLQVDGDIQEEHTTSIFEVDVCRLRNMLGYIARLQRSWILRLMGGGHETELGLTKRND